MKPPYPSCPFKKIPIPSSGTGGLLTQSCASRNGTVVCAASLPMSLWVNLTKVLVFDSGNDLLLVRVGMFGFLRLISLRFLLPLAPIWSVLSFDTQKLFSGSKIWPVLKYLQRKLVSERCYSLTFTWRGSRILSSQDSDDVQLRGISLRSDGYGSWFKIFLKSNSKNILTTTWPTGALRSSKSTSRLSQASVW